MQTRNAKFSGVNLLLVDDEHYCHLLISKVLSKTGINIIHAYNGAQAVELAKKFRPEVAFIDIVMPVKNGCEVAKEIKLLNPDIVCVAYTADSNRYNWSEHEKLGFDRVILKPALPDEIVKKLEDSLIKAEEQKL